MGEKSRVGSKVNCPCQAFHFKHTILLAPSLLPLLTKLEDMKLKLIGERDEKSFKCMHFMLQILSHLPIYSPQVSRASLNNISAIQGEKINF